MKGCWYFLSSLSLRANTLTQSLLFHSALSLSCVQPPEGWQLHMHRVWLQVPYLISSFIIKSPGSQSTLLLVLQTTSFCSTTSLGDISHMLLYDPHGFITYLSHPSSQLGAINRACFLPFLSSLLVASSYKNKVFFWDSMFKHLAGWDFAEKDVAWEKNMECENLFWECPKGCGWLWNMALTASGAWKCSFKNIDDWLLKENKNIMRQLPPSPTISNILWTRFCLDFSGNMFM